MPTRSMGYIFLLTLAIGGLQISWSTEFSNGTPFLLSLGMSKTLMSLVWIAGPLSGVLVQPIVGMLSDSSKSRFGKRRPFMVGGTCFTILSLFLLSWSIDIVRVLFGWFVDNLTVVTQTFAVLMVYMLDFSIGTVQASSRAIIVDNAPIHQQQTANAFAAVLTGAGNIVGFILGVIDLPKVFPFLGNTQFRVLAFFASLALIISVGLACLYIHERNPNLEGSGAVMVEQETHPYSIPEFYSKVKRGVTRLSPQVRLICDTEFFAWIGYFPMLFYTTTYVGEMYYREQMDIREANSLPPLSDDEIDKLWEAATRYASRALLLYSIMSLTANLVLPLIVAPSYSDPNDAAAKTATSASSRLRIKWLTLPRSWMLSHLVFAAAMFSTFFIHTGAQASVMITLLGIPWAHALWAPFALIAEDVARVKAKLRHPSMIYKYEHEAGIIMGVHNVFVSLPQVLSSLGSSILFKLLAKPGRGDAGDNSIVWIFRLSGFGALVAAYLSTKIKTPDQIKLEDIFDEQEEEEEEGGEENEDVEAGRNV
ncbi:major facilitator superfamily domain-containing protein [Myxozyma melibiosi]|uniref:Major facilitator superfamily domain-containing protein n=1 Tax=Myxozyma melibiosi TaxID=54550 RepID=A0ABR1FCD1_9ASCO